MKITNIETFLVDSGWWPFLFVKIETDEGITGYGECTETRQPHGVVGSIEDFSKLLIGKDPRSFEMLLLDLKRISIQSRGGIAYKAISGIELALLDIKAKALNISVVELFGGPTRENIRLYWSHCGTYRARNYELCNTPPLESLKDIYNLGKEVIEKGYTALKTNIIIPGKPAQTWGGGFAGPIGSTDGVIPKDILTHLDNQIGTFRDAVGEDIDINLDLNFHVNPESAKRIADVVEKYNLMWLEIDMYQPDALRELKDSINIPICSGENLLFMQEYLPYFQARSADIFMIDVPWMGFSQGKKVGDLAETFQFNVAPHNYYSHLSSFISASLCAVLPNIKIMEIDVDQVSWKDDLVTNVPEITDGYMKTPSGIGWGTNLNEDALKEHLWDK